MALHRRTLAWIVWAPVLVAMFLLWPSSLGGRISYIQVSGTSMEPTMHTGDLAVVRRKAHYDVGDIVAYRIPKGNPAAGYLVIHRVIGGSGGAGYVIQGDNRATVDIWKPLDGDVVGERWFLVPRAGTALRFLANPLGVGIFFGALAFVLVVTYKPKPSASSGADPEPELVA